MGCRKQKHKGSIQPNQVVNIARVVKAWVVKQGWSKRIPYGFIQKGVQELIVNPTVTRKSLLHVFAVTCVSIPHHRSV